MIKWVDFTGITINAVIYHPTRWLLLTHRNKECRDEPNTRGNMWWGLKFWETLADGIRRELQEEMWWEFEDRQIIPLWYREQFRKHDGQKTHRIAFTHLIILKWNEILQNMEPEKCDGIDYFALDDLPPKAQTHSMFYPTLKDFKREIERLIGKEIILN